jgi:hypothetical protein
MIGRSSTKTQLLRLQHADVFAYHVLEFGEEQIGHFRFVHAKIVSTAKEVERGCFTLRRNCIEHPKLKASFAVAFVRACAGVDATGIERDELLRVARGTGLRTLTSPDCEIGK